MNNKLQITNYKLQIANDKSPRVVSPDEVVDTLEVLLESLYALPSVCRC